MKVKKTIADDHSINEIYNLVLKIKEELREFKISASDINLRMEVIEEDMGYLKMNALPDLLNKIIVEVDEIKDRIDTNFNYQNENNIKCFNQFSNENKKDIMNLGDNLTKDLTTPLNGIDESLNDINYRVTQILAILEKKK